MTFLLSFALLNHIFLIMRNLKAAFNNFRNSQVKGIKRSDGITWRKRDGWILYLEGQRNFTEQKVRLVMSFFVQVSDFVTNGYLVVI